MHRTYRSPLALLSLLATALLMVGNASVARADHGECMHEVDPEKVDTTTTAQAHATGAASRVTIYLARDGADLVAGHEDSASNRSAVLPGYGLDRVSIPAFSGTGRTWDAVVECVQGRLADFDVRVVDQRPSGDYIMAVVGGRASVFGYGSQVTGLAPFTGDVIPNATVFVFEQNARGDVNAICESILHEVGHALGLEHAYLCEDPMSYLGGCGDKTFQDVEAACGEYDPRSCTRGRATQNSYDRLAEVMGLRMESPLPSPERPSPERPSRNRGVDPPPDRADAASLAVRVIEARTEWSDGTRFAYVVADSARASRLELGWWSPQGSYTFRCDAMPSDLPVACVQRGPYHVFVLAIGQGQRAFALRARDGNGRVATTGTWVLR